MAAEPNDPEKRAIADTIYKFCDGDAGRPIMNRDMALVLTEQISEAIAKAKRGPLQRAADVMMGR